MFERVEGWNKLQIACTFDIRGKKMALKTRHFSENSGVDKKWNDIWEAWMSANLTSVKECSYHAYLLEKKKLFCFRKRSFWSSHFRGSFSFYFLPNEKARLKLDLLLASNIFVSNINTGFSRFISTIFKK